MLFIDQFRRGEFDALSEKFAQRQRQICHLLCVEDLLLPHPLAYLVGAELRLTKLLREPLYPFFIIEI